MGSDDSAVLETRDAIYKTKAPSSWMGLLSCSWRCISFCARGYCMVVFENEFKKTNTRSQTQKYLSLGKFTLAPLCEPHKIEIVQEKRQVTFIAIVVGCHESMPCLLAHNYLFSKPTGHSLTCGFCLLRNRANCRQLKTERL